MARIRHLQERNSRLLWYTPVAEKRQGKAKVGNWQDWQGNGVHGSATANARASYYDGLSPDTRRYYLGCRCVWEVGNR
jgi:formylglycine-generating enzyme required for sulfatase activity